MKAEIHRGRQKESGLSETEKKQLLHLMRDEAMLTARTKLLKELQAAGTSDKYFLFTSLKKSAGWSNPPLSS